MYRHNISSELMLSLINNIDGMREHMFDSFVTNLFLSLAIRPCISPTIIPKQIDTHIINGFERQREIVCGIVCKSNTSEINLYAHI